MASAYELNLILRGRNYLSNDLRRAGADLSRMRNMSQLQNTRSQLNINAQRLANTKAIAQTERDSVTTGGRRLALDKAIAAQKISEANSLQNIRRAESSLLSTDASRLKNAAQLSKLNRALGAGGLGNARGFTNTETKQLRDAAAAQQSFLAEQAVTQRRQVEIAQSAYSKNLITMQQLIEREAALAATEARLTDVINNTSASLDLNSVKLDENAMAMKRLPLEQLGARAKYVEHLGRTFQTLGLISAAALGAMAYAAARFNTQITLAATQSTLPTNNTTGQVQRNATFLQKQVQDLLVAGKTAAKPADLTGGLYTIFSGLSLQGNQKAQLNEGLNILKEFNKVFTANYGQVSFNDVTKAGIALINNFGLSAKSIPSVMNSMQASVRFGAMTMSEMTSSLNQIIPAFKGAGYSAKQMFQDIAFVSRVFPSLRIGTTGLARLTETFGKFHDEISRDVGINIAPGGRLLPVNQIVEAIVKAHPALVKGGVDLQNYFKSVTGSQQFVNARRVFTAYATQLGLYHDVAGKVAGDNNELAKSFTDMQQAPQVRWTELTNQLHGLVLEIGTAALPIFAKFIGGPLKNMVHWFDTLSPSTKKLVGEISALVAIGALVGGTGLVVVGIFSRMYAALRLLLLGKAGVVAAEDGFVSAGAALRIGLIGALILAIPLMIKYHSQTQIVINALGGFKNVLRGISAIVTVLTFTRLIRNLSGIQSAAALAGGELGLVARNLALINGFVAVATVVIIYRRQIKDFVNNIASKLPGQNIDPTNLERKIPGLGWLQDKTSGLMNILTFGTAGDVNRAADKKALDQFRRTHNIPAFSTNNPLGAVAALTAGLSKVKPPQVPYKAGASILKQPPPPFTDANVLAAVRNIVKLDELAKRKPTLANFKAANAALLDLQGKANKDQLSAAQDLINALESQQSKADKKSVSDTKKAANERLQAIKDAQANVMSMYDELLQQNQSVMGQLFSGPYINSPVIQDRLQYGGQLTGTDYLKDLKSQTGQFRAFFAQIGRLQRRGAPQELVQQLIQAGPSALPAIKALSSMGKNQWNQYIKVFKDGQDLLHKQTMIQLKAQLKDYRKYGSSIALQIISGMRDKRLGLTNELKKLIEGMFGVDVPVVHAPTKTAIAAATRAAKGRTPGHPASTYTGSTTHSKPIIGTHTRSTQGVTINHNYNVVAPTSEHTSIKTQLRHAEFARKSKLKVIP